jgi:hypothetical protein
LDYIIFGIGSGASLILFGWMLREWGPSLRDRTSSDDDVLSASDLVMRMAWARFCATSGMALVLCGCLILIATAIAAALAVSDDRGGMIVLIAFALAAPLMLLWLWLYLRQFGAFGVIRRQPKPEPTTEATPARATAASVAPGTSAGESPDMAPEPSFTEAVASPGGLGRFSAFFRKDSSQTTAQSEEAAADSEAAVELGGADVDETTATEKVIAAISGEAGAGESKRLDPTDPLVTDVYGERARTLEAASDVPGASESTGESPSPHEAAVDALRKRRIARLAASHPPDRDA